MEKLPKTNNGFGVIPALKALSIKDSITNVIVKGIGFAYGSKKVTHFDNSAIFPVTAPSNLSRSKITGFTKHLGNISIIQPFATSFMTEPIFTNKDAL